MKVNSLLTKSLNLEDFIYIILVCLFCFFFSNVLLKSSDIGCILSSGTYIIENHSVYLPDNSLFTGTSSFWVNCNWLSDVILTAVYKIGNYKLILVFCSILISALFAILLRQMMQKFNNWPINIALLTIGILACWNFLGISSKLFSYIFLLLYIFFLNNIAEKCFSKNKLICLLVITVLWANVRSDFLIGISIVFVYSFSFYLISLVRDKNQNISIAKVFLLIGAASLVFSLVNPYGLNLIVMVLKYFGSSLYLYNGDLVSPDFHIKLPFFFFELLIVLYIFLAMFSDYKVPLYKLLSLVFLLILSLLAAVNIPFFIIVSLPILSDIINNSNELEKIPYYKRFLTFSNMKSAENYGLIIFIFSILIIALVFIVPDYDKKLSNIKVMPIQAVKFIKDNNIQGRMFNPLGWGCYLSNELGCKAFIDERMYKISPKILEDYKNIVYINRKYPEILSDNKVDWIIIPEFMVLNQFLINDKSWNLIYKDNKAVVYIRNNYEEKE